MVPQNISFAWAHFNRAHTIKRCEERGDSKRYECAWMGFMHRLGAYFGGELDATLRDVITPGSSWLVNTAHGKVGFSPALQPAQWAGQQERWEPDENGSWIVRNQDKDRELNNSTNYAEPGSELLSRCRASTSNCLEWPCAAYFQCSDSWHTIVLHTRVKANARLQFAIPSF